MTHRERFLATMRYEPVDRIPLYDFNFWNETVPEWHKQGLDEGWTRRNIHLMLGLDQSLGGGEDNAVLHIGANSSLKPRFEQKVIEDLGDEQIIRDGSGVLLQVHKKHVSIPPHVGHTLVDKASWKEHFLPKLNPDTPGRFGEHFDEQVARATASDCDKVVQSSGGSLFGWLRDWMGMENIALVPYDDPAWFEEMVTTVADLQVAILTRAFERGMRIQWLHMWEDMCYNAGPLLSPKFFKQYLVPHYKRITELARKYGCEFVSVDCDGKIDDLLPMWLEAGVNVMFPMEIGNWADPVAYRKEYGRVCLMMGGFDKHLLAKGSDAIDAEIKRLTPLVEEGGFIPFCDHRVPPDVPLVNYVHYCDRVREACGRGVDLPEKLSEPPVVAAAS